MTSQIENVSDLLLDGKERNRIALLTLSREYNYGELADGSSAISAFLLSHGGTKGDRVLLISENSYFWIVSYLGILKAGLVCVPVPVSTTPEDLRYLLDQTDARFVLLQSKYCPKFENELRKAQILIDQAGHQTSGLESLDTLSPSGSTQITFPPVYRDDLATLMFTSGSTGQSRGVMISHENIQANTRSIVEYLGLSSADRMMTVLPFHYCFGTSLLHTHLLVGGSLVLDNRFMYPEAILRRMLETECTGFAGVPSHYQVLLRRTSLRKMQFPNLRHVQQAGGHLSEVFLKELQQALPSTRIFVMYGQTEATARLSFLSPEMLGAKSGSIGKAIPGVKLSIILENGEMAAPGEVGEIVAEGPNIGKGYWGCPTESNGVFRDGRLFTGDQALMDEDGYIRIVGRTRDFLKCGGTRTSCKQIEDVLLEYKDLVEVAVLGIPDSRLGEAVKAFVVPTTTKGFDDVAFMQFCRSRLSFQLVPREVVTLRALPKNDSGKVLKDRLKALPTGSPRTTVT